jgi:hypothetical protein
MGSLPAQAGHSGQYLKTDGSNPAWDWISGTASPTIPLGDPTVDGSWQLVVTGGNLSFQRRESGVWNEKGQVTL